MITATEMKQFDRFLAESFPEGVNSRELRLSPEEAEYLRSKHPQATLEPMAQTSYEDGKTWFLVRL